MWAFMHQSDENGYREVMFDSGVVAPDIIGAVNTLVARFEYGGASCNRAPGHWGRGLR
ncbi:hypothetical protein P3T23_003004 [Paraburkholderia sp. GAS448]